MGEADSITFSKRTMLVVTLAVALVAGAAGAVLASHHFNDVPDSHVFHEQIGAIADAGVTTGVGDGSNFAPGQQVTRGQMAAFMERGFGRIGYGIGFGILDPAASSGATEATIASVEVQAGANGSGGGYVKLDGSASIFTGDVANCPCEVAAYIEDSAGNQISQFNYESLDDSSTEIGDANASIPATAGAELAADTTETYHLIVEVFDTDVSAVHASGDLTATYAPLDANNDVSVLSENESGEQRPGAKSRGG